MSKTTNKGLQVRSMLDVGPSGADIGGLLQLAKKNGTKLVEIARSLARQGKLRWDDPAIDLQALFRETIDIQCEVRAHIPGIGERTLTTSAFPVLSGVLTAELLERTDQVAPPVWQKICSVRPTNKDTTHLVRIVNSDSSHVGGNKRKEGDPYPLMTSAEERVQVDTVDDGRRIAINAKVIETNDKPGLIDQINALREWANERRDKIALYRAYDLYGSGASPSAPYVYRPNGVGAALYTTSTTALSRAPSGTRVVNNPIVDDSSLQALINVMAAMLNENGNKVSALEGLQILAPHALGSKLFKLLSSEKVPGVENEVNPFGPMGLYKIEPIISPKIDAFTTTSVILGREFPKAFVLVSRLDMEYMSMAASMQDYLRTRLAFEARIADEFEIGARDHNRCVQSLSNETAPTGPTLGS